MFLPVESTCLILVPRLYQIHNVPQWMSPKHNIIQPEKFLDIDVALEKSVELLPTPATLPAQRPKWYYGSVWRPAAEELLVGRSYRRALRFCVKTWGEGSDGCWRPRKASWEASIGSNVPGPAEIPNLRG